MSPTSYRTAPPRDKTPSEETLYNFIARRRVCQLFLRRFFFGAHNFMQKVLPRRTARLPRRARTEDRRLSRPRRQQTAKQPARPRGTRPRRICAAAQENARAAVPLSGKATKKKPNRCAAAHVCRGAMPVAAQPAAVKTAFPHRGKAEKRYATPARQRPFPFIFPNPNSIDTALPNCRWSFPWRMRRIYPRPPRFWGRGSNTARR